MPKINVDKKITVYILPVCVFFIALACIVNMMFVSTIFFVLCGVLLLPNVKEKIKLPNILLKIITFLIFIIAFFALVVESPEVFIGKWKSKNSNIQIEFKSDNTFSIIDNNQVIDGNYSFKRNDDNIVITLEVDDDLYKDKKFKYVSDNSVLCILNNEECVDNFVKVKNK